MEILNQANISKSAIYLCAGFRNNARMTPEWIREQLKAAGKKQIDLARHIGLEPPQVNKILKGTRKISADEADLIRDFFGLAVTIEKSALTSDLPDGRRVTYENSENYALPPMLPRLMVVAVIDGSTGLYVFGVSGRQAALIEVQEDFRDGAVYPYTPQHAWHSGIAQVNGQARTCRITGIARSVTVPCNTDLD